MAVNKNHIDTLLADIENNISVQEFTSLSKTLQEKLEIQKAGNRFIINIDGTKGEFFFIEQNLNERLKGFAPVLQFIMGNLPGENQLVKVQLNIGENSIADVILTRLPDGQRIKKMFRVVFCDALQIEAYLINYFNKCYLLEH